jgi:hypothetical protein
MRRRLTTVLHRTRLWRAGDVHVRRAGDQSASCQQGEHRGNSPAQRPVWEAESWGRWDQNGVAESNRLMSQLGDCAGAVKALEVAVLGVVD